MKKMINSLSLVIVVVLSMTCAFAEINLDDMTLDEMLSLQEQLDAAIEAAQGPSDSEVEQNEGLAVELDASQYTELANGSKGDEVVALQTRLFELGFYSSIIDGDFGNGTMLSIKEFEDYNGLEPTGVATPELQALIYSDIAKPKPVAVSSITVLDKNLTALVGSTFSIADIVAVSPENATEQGVTYALDGEEYATIDENGVLVAKERGEATVTVTSLEKVENPKNATVKVKIRQPSKTLSLNEKEINIGKGSNFKLEATVGPENADDKSVSWTSSNQEISTVSSNGSVTAKSCGECDIICTTNDGSGVSTTCHVIVTQLVTSIKLSDSKIVLARGKTQAVDAIVSPPDATNKDVVWETSNPSIAGVTSNGKILASRGGDCEITCTAADGSGKQATVKVHVPTFSVEKTEYTVTSKSGLRIPVEINDYRKIWADSNASCFDFDWIGNELFIDPIKAGSGTVKLYNEEVKEDTINLKITVDHSAVYDSKSYPKASYEDILRYPNRNQGDNFSIYGKVLQKTESFGTVGLRVGTGGYGYYDKVFWVEYRTSEVSARVIEDDYITVYGTCDGAYTYTTIMGALVTIPSINAEKVIIGRK